MRFRSGGFFELTAVAKDADGRSTTTKTSFYSLGTGYTAWERFDHNRINLVPEKNTYKPGDSARIMIQSPWERATALLTTEREGVRSRRQFELTSTQQYVTVPITEDDIPNLFVSVLLVKGRTKDDTPDDGSDPGKPSFRLGYTELKVEDASKRLTVGVTANKTEYRPANSAHIDLDVKDVSGKPASSEVTLWAVDYGVLSLTAFRTPDVLRSVYVEKSLQVTNTDNRQRLVSRRAIVPKGEDEGGGGGNDSGVDSLRKDFNVLAFWLGSIVTDANGKASADIKLPESLTTYRIMAVAADKTSRFGSGESEIRINKPLMLKSAFPRFLAVGDSALFGSVVTSQLAEGGSAVVTMRSLDPSVLEIRGATSQTIQIGPNGSAEVRFSAVARGIGPARVQMSARLARRDRCVRGSAPGGDPRVAGNRRGLRRGAAHRQKKRSPCLPVSCPGLADCTSSCRRRPWSVSAKARAIWSNIPYGCAEQQASRAFALILASDLGDAFHLPGIDPKNLRTHLADDASRAREVPVSERRLRVLAGRVLLDVALPHVVHPPRLQSGGVAEIRPRQGRASSVRIRISRRSWQSRTRRIRVGGRPTPPGRHSPSRSWSKAAAIRIRTSTACISGSIACRCSRCRICSTRSSPKERRTARASTSSTGA